MKYVSTLQKKKKNAKYSADTSLAIWHFIKKENNVKGALRALFCAPKAAISPPPSWRCMTHHTSHTTQRTLFVTQQQRFCPSHIATQRQYHHEQITGAQSMRCAPEELQNPHNFIVNYWHCVCTHMLQKKKNSIKPLCEIIFSCIKFFIIE